jgi:hypothetical protein
VCELESGPLNRGVADFSKLLNPGSRSGFPDRPGSHFIYEKPARQKSPMDKLADLFMIPSE